jgi:adenylylsulfate kinase
MKPAVIWLIGYSGAGKTTLAERLADTLRSAGTIVEVLDGDVARNRKKQTDFSREARLKHLRTMALEAAELELAGKVVVGAFITPYEEARSFLRRACQRYIEVWVDTTLADCEKRDPKGLYGKARRGEIAHFTGISDAFEEPREADIRLTTAGRTVEDTLAELTQKLAALAK